MTELKGLCEAAGFKDCRTYIQSGNVVFRSPLSEPSVKAKLEKALSTKLGKAGAAMVRTRAELEAAIKRNPYKSALPSRVMVLFLDEAPARDALSGLHIPGREKVKLEGREVFVHYPDGMGHSKLKLPFAAAGTGRNLNTLVKLAGMAAELEHN
jgi:uncharacterized protein (DUF1697 family)